MRYLPHTQADIDEMLAAVGLNNLDELFEQIPENSRRIRPLNLPEAMTEWELTAHMQELAAAGGGDWQVFAHAGSQPHHIPAIVPYLASRSEFLTSYTPYQPEISQGTLQAIFEFQTLISRLVGLDVTNASMYDGSTAMAEATLMAMRITKRRRVAVSALVHPHWRQVLSTYLAPLADVELITLPAGPDGRTDFSGLCGEPAVLVMQSPNFLGVIEDLEAASQKIKSLGGLLAAGFSEPFALGLIKSPGELGADIVFGEAQSLGLAQAFGGPTLGLLSCKTEFVRQIPGRLVGRSKDVDGKDGFVLTLATREQHIRRSRAVSNICSNAGHCALTCSIFMAAIGGSGFRQTAQVNLDLAAYLRSGLEKLGFRRIGSAPVFNEFAMHAPNNFEAVHERLKSQKILAGLSLNMWKNDIPGFNPEGVWLFGVTETSGKARIDALLREIEKGA
ncbi:MAG: aminomethyl-transferring glycine dehydrogenase subunit GcvPA [Desulfovibrionaceae bacterium]|nr:aminomethyl-transferring glycine dehydrogenase subunit GcvPA [Desulfovibrionaceae bacterium]